MLLRSCSHYLGVIADVFGKLFPCLEGTLEKGNQKFSQVGEGIPMGSDKFYHILVVPLFSVKSPGVVQGSWAKQKIGVVDHSRHMVFDAIVVQAKVQPIQRHAWSVDVLSEWNTDNLRIEGHN